MNQAYQTIIYKGKTRLLKILKNLKYKSKANQKSDEI